MNGICAFSGHGAGNEYRLFEGDCFENMASLEEHSIDLVCADLPYGTTFNKWDSRLSMERLWESFRRVCKPGAAVVLSTQQPFTSVVAVSNLKNYRCEWIWEKGCATGFLNAQVYPLKAHENILVFCDRAPIYNPQKTYGHKNYTGSDDGVSQNYGKYRSKRKYGTDGSRFPRTVLKFAHEKGHHPTQKPAPLLEYLIRTHSNPGGVVLDCVMGSGSTGVAALRAGRLFIGIERDAKYFAAAGIRIAEAAAALQGVIHE